MSGVQGTVEQLTIALGTAVLHSLWQCALIGTVSAVLMLLVRRANTRYIVWCVSMLLCAVWMGLTFVGVMWPGGSGGGAADELGFGRVLPMMMPSVAPASSTILLEVIAWLWVGGFVYCTIRYAQQWGAARRLRTRDLVEVEHRWSDLFEEVRAGLGVSRRVGMLVSTRAPSPMVVGWLSPVVIVPMSALSMLSPEQVRLVLVHELAHIRRYDHVVNMLQVLIETALFYHPVVWWMSHQARLEREHCCDDAAVRWGGDAVAFARALTELETTRTGSRAVLALNPMNHGGSLMNRITRILGSSESHRLGNGSLRMLVALSAGTLVAVAGIANAALRTHEPRGAQIEVVRANVESGVMTQAQARRIFDEIIYPGSDMQQKMDAELDRVGMEIERAVQSGRITAEQGRMKLDAVRDGMDERREYHFRMQVLGMTKRKAELSLLRDELDALVGAGEVTREEADAKYAAAVGAMTQPVGTVQERAVRDYKGAIENAQAMRQAIDEYRKKLDAAVEAGTMTREDALVRDEVMHRKYEMIVLQVEDAKRLLIELGAKDQADGLVLPGVGEDALRYQQETERGSLSHFEKNLRAGLMDSVRADVEAGRVSKKEAQARILSEERAQQFQARWMSVVLMYQEEVLAGRLTVQAANKNLRRAMDANGFFESEFAWDIAKGGMQIVEADHVFEVMVTPDGKPVGAEFELELKAVEPKPETRKLTPMDDAYFYHQGIRALSEYEEENPDDC